MENGGAPGPPRSPVANTTQEAPEEPRPVEREPAQGGAESDAPSTAASIQEESEDGRETGVDLASGWQGIMGELKRRRQALTAAVYGEARVEGFDGKVLRLVYPEEQSFHVGMAKEQATSKSWARSSRSAWGRSRASKSGPRGEHLPRPREPHPPETPIERRPPGGNRRPKTGSPRWGIRTEREGPSPRTVVPARRDG